MCIADSNHRGGEGKKTLKSICDALFPKHSLSSAAAKQTALVVRGSFCLSVWIQHSLGKCKAPMGTPPSVTAHREALMLWLE